MASTQPRAQGLAVDHPILFSGPMVSALLDGRKTQTRRLASSPLRRVAVGDQLYVREAWRTTAVHDRCKPTSLSPHGLFQYEASFGSPLNGKLRPAMFMPRWLSRITLKVQAVRFEAVQAISETDAIAEGLVWDRTLEAWNATGEPNWPRRTDPRESYAGLWNSLHEDDGQRWDDNPQVVALSFAVERANIDSLG